MFKWEFYSANKQPTESFCHWLRNCHSRAQTASYHH